MKKGFSLVEIIIVIIIIGTLAAVAVPKLFKIKDKAKMSAELTEIANIKAEIAKLHGEWILNDSFDWSTMSAPGATPSVGDWNDTFGYPNSFGTGTKIDYLLQNSDIQIVSNVSTNANRKGTPALACPGDLCLKGVASRFKDGAFKGKKSSDGYADNNRTPDFNDYWEYNKTNGTIILKNILNPI